MKTGELISDSDPAFPFVCAEVSKTQCVYSGMRQLDYFAAKAMQAGIRRWGGGGSMYDEGGCTHSKLAQESYQIAVAMLAEGRKYIRSGE